MVKSVTPVTRCGRVIAGVAGPLMAGLLMTTSPLAQTLKDPTRPPDSLRATGDNGLAAPAVVLELQSIRTGPGKKSAMINGQLLQLNDRLGEFRLVRIDESQVTLRNGKSEQRLTLFPDIDMQPVHRAAR